MKRDRAITKKFYRIWSPTKKIQVGDTTESYKQIVALHLFLSNSGLKTIIQVSTVTYTPFRRLK